MSGRSTDIQLNLFILQIVYVTFVTRYTQYIPTDECCFQGQTSPCLARSLGGCQPPPTQPLVPYDEKLFNKCPIQGYIM